jgi:RNA recognition motif-containing protein
VKPSITKEKAVDLKKQQTLDIAHKKEEEDKRNLNMAKEGLLMEENWIHKEPALSKKAQELRQRLWISKSKALKESTNLFVSKTRLQVRNLPRREFDVPELKELMKVVAEEWSKTLSPDDVKKFYKGKKLITHAKIMKDQVKTDTDTGEALGNGIAFVEFSNEDLALYAV